MSTPGTAHDADTAPEHEHPGAVPVPHWLSALCRWMATLGGVILAAMMLMTVASVTRRTLLGSPIPGDFEMVEQMTAMAIFCFLPWCQVSGGNVLVDFFTARAGPRLNHVFEASGDLLYLGAAALIGWRLWFGAADLRMYGEQSMVLHYPVWLSFIVVLPAMALLVLTCAFTFGGHLRKAFR